MHKKSPLSQKPIEDVNSYVQAAMEEMRTDLKIKTDKIEIDYVCFRCNDSNHYAVFMSYFYRFGETLAKDIIVKGRRVSVFKLNTPIKVRSGRRNRYIKTVRITGYKESSPHPTGWGHVSFTLPSKVPLNNWVKAHPHIPFSDKRNQVDEMEIIETRTTLPTSHIPIRFNAICLEEIIFEQKGI